MNSDIDSFEEARSIDWVDLLKRRYKVGLAVFVPVFLASFLAGSYFNSAEPIYLSYAKLIIERRGVEGSAASKAIMARESGHRTVMVFKSEPVFQKAAHILAEEFGYLELSESRYTEMLKESVRVDVAGKRERLNGGVAVSARTTSPELSYDMVSAMIQAYKKHIFDLEQEKFESTYNLFSVQIDKAKNSLFDAENELVEFVSKNEEIAYFAEEYDIEGAAQDSDIATTLSKIHIGLKNAIKKEEDFVNELEQLAISDKMAALDLLTEVKNKEGYESIKETYIEKEEHLNKLLEINQEIHPAVIESRGEMAIIEKKVNREIYVAVRGIKIKLDELRAKEERLVEMKDAGLFKKIISYSLIKGDIHNKREIYNRLAADLQNLDLGKRLKSQMDFRVITQHKLPEKPISGGTNNSLLISIFVSAGCMAATLYVLDYFDKSVRTIDQLERMLDISVLAGIPENDDKSDKSFREERDKG